MGGLVTQFRQSVSGGKSGNLSGWGLPGVSGLPSPNAPGLSIPQTTADNYRRNFEAYMSRGAQTVSPPTPGGTAPRLPVPAPIPGSKTPIGNNPTFSYAQSVSTDYGLLGQILRDAQAQYAPELMSLQASVDRARGMSALTNASYGRQMSALGKVRDLDLEGNGIDQMGVNFQLHNIPQFLDLINRQHGINIGRAISKGQYLDELDGFARDARSQDERSFGIARDDINFNAGVNRRNTQGAAVSTGMVGSGAARTNINDINFEASRRLKDVDVEDARSNTKLQSTLAANMQSRRDLNWDIRQSGLTRKESELKLKEREGLLKLQAAQLGLDRRKLEAKYRLEMEKMGLDRIMSVGQFAESMETLRRQQMAAQRGIGVAAANDPRVSGVSRTVSTPYPTAASVRAHQGR